MDPSNLTAFRVMKARLQWLGQRQEVLAQNVSNANTPGFRPTDLEPFTFRMALDQTRGRVQPAMTQAGHLPSTRPTRGSGADAVEDRNFFETSPDGNRVVLEQQMMRIAETGIDYQTVTNLYRKQVGMFRMVVGRGSGG
jgi:flagellar basal-body rod protein FlgB